MLILFVFFAALLLAGSLFPWQFMPGPDLAQAARHVLTGWQESALSPRRSDVLVNLVIYIPIGFTGYLWRGWRGGLARIGGTLLAGTLLSFSVETLQHYFPPRMPSTGDVVCNAISTALGLALAAVFESAVTSRQIDWRRRYSVQFSSALLLLAIWIAALAWPDHPFPLGIGMRLRALSQTGVWAPLESAAGVLLWLTAGCLLTAVVGARAARWCLWALLPIVFLLMLISPGHDFTWSYGAGSLAAALLFSFLPPRFRSAGTGLACAWLLWIVIDGTRPYMFLEAPQRFVWIPFQDMLGSRWMPGIGVLLRKTWTYGAAFWLLSHSRFSRNAAFGLALAVITAVEAVQPWLPERVGGLTDPAIAALAAALLWQVDRHFSRPVDTGCAT